MAKKLPSQEIIERREAKERLQEMAEALAVHWDLAAIDRQQPQGRVIGGSPDEMTETEIKIAHAYGSVISALNSFDR